MLKDWDKKTSLRSLLSNFTRLDGDVKTILIPPGVTILGIGSRHRLDSDSFALPIFSNFPRIAVMVRQVIDGLMTGRL